MNPVLTMPQPVENGSPKPAGPASSQAALVVLGINHTTAPIELRERLAIPAGRLAEATRTLLDQSGVREALILSTCNRVEFVTLQESSGHSIGTSQSAPHALQSPALLRFLAEYFALPAAELAPHLYEFREREAVRHLFRVASSLDSMVVGEPQILGQVKEAWNVGREVGAVATALDPLLQRAFSVAKRVRSETQIGSSSVSIASVAIDLAHKIFGSLQGKTVLLVGAGKMSELAARHLIQQGATSILVANRTVARAEKIAADIAAQVAASDGSGSNPTRCETEVIPFDRLYAQAGRADIVISSTGAAAQLFSPAHAREFMGRRKNRPMFFIDIAVPRDVDPRVNEVEGCFVYDIDDLQQVAAANRADRRREADAAETIVAAEVERYHQHLQSLDAIPAIKALQASAESVREAEVARTVSKLAASAPLTPAQQAAVEALSRSLTAKLLHPQLTALRRQPEE